MRIDIDEKKIKEAEELLADFPKKIPAAIKRALDRGISNINVNVSKEVRAVYHIKAGVIKDTVNVLKATTGHLGASVTSKGTRIGLNHFKVSPSTINPRRKSPIKAAVKKEGGQKSLGKGFMANINGPKVFKRSGSSRLPIERIFGPSVPSMLRNEEVREKIQTQGLEMFERTLDHEINRILNKSN